MTVRDTVFVGLRVLLGVTEREGLAVVDGGRDVRPWEGEGVRLSEGDLVGVLEAVRLRVWVPRPLVLVGVAEVDGVTLRLRVGEPEGLTL